MLREWKDELDEPSPAFSSLLGGASLGGTFSIAELCRLLEHCDEEDDAINALKEIDNPNPESQALEAPSLDVGTFAGDINSNLFHDDSYFMNPVPQEHGYELYDQGVGQHGESPSVMHPNMFNNYEAFNEFDLDQFDLHQKFDHNLSIDFDGTKKCGEDAGQSSSQAGPNMRFPTSGISGPKCALWDCTRRAQGSEWLEFNIVDGKNKRLKVKVTNDDPVVHLQKQMGKLTADVPAENNPSVKSKPKGK
ncbi:hypothetical protein MKX03_022561 [Papaver bracteatum]|nr:hypothetical protein MKX03_022561 [Papaver bracteatum]